jgi:hypothetical protein
MKCYAFNAAAGSKQPALSEAQCGTLAAMRLSDFAIAPFGLGLLPHSPLPNPICCGRCSMSATSYRNRNIDSRVVDPKRLGRYHRLEGDRDATDEI